MIFAVRQLLYASSCYDTIVLLFQASLTGFDTDVAAKSRWRKQEDVARASDVECQASSDIIDHIHSITYPPQRYYPFDRLHLLTGYFAQYLHLLDIK